MGAWIEIENYKVRLDADIVAPFMGAWIEMEKKLAKNYF